ncbi:unnamed protein product [Absidia cylindrospora]
MTPNIDGGDAASLCRVGAGSGSVAGTVAGVVVGVGAGAGVVAGAVAGAVVGAGAGVVAIAAVPDTTLMSLMVESFVGLTFDTSCCN